MGGSRAVISGGAALRKGFLRLELCDIDQGTMHRGRHRAMVRAHGDDVRWDLWSEHGYRMVVSTWRDGAQRRDAVMMEGVMGAASL